MLLTYGLACVLLNTSNKRGEIMLVQVITLTYPDGDQTTYVDQVGTEDAAESYFMLEQHLADGDFGTIKECKLYEVTQ